MHENYIATTGIVLLKKLIYYHPLNEELIYKILLSYNIMIETLKITLLPALMTPAVLNISLHSESKIIYYSTMCGVQYVLLTDISSL